MVAAHSLPVKIMVLIPFSLATKNPAASLVLNLFNSLPFSSMAITHKSVPSLMLDFLFSEFPLLLSPAMI